MIKMNGISFVVKIQVLLCTINSKYILVLLIRKLSGFLIVLVLELEL